MSTAVSPSSAAAGSNNVQSIRKLAKTGKETSVNKIGDHVPTAALATVFQRCGPLYVVDTTRTYTNYDSSGGTYNNHSYSVQVLPMAADSTRYLFSTNDSNSVSHIEDDLDLGTENLHVIGIAAGGTNIDTNFLPGDTAYFTYLRDMLNYVSYTWHYNSPVKGDTTTFPEMAAPSHFIQCIINDLGGNAVKEPQKKPNSAETSKASFKAKVIFNTSGKTDPSVKMFDITGKAVRNASKVTPGLYIILNK